MSNWTKRRQMEFNISKCNVFSFGNENPRKRYNIHNELVRKSDNGRYFVGFSELEFPSKKTVY